MGLTLTEDHGFVPAVEPKLGPSYAHRWFNCSGSAWLTAIVPPRSSVSADTGTIKHGILEALAKGTDIPDSVELDYKTKERGPVTPEIVKEMSELWPGVKADISLFNTGKIEAEQWGQYTDKGTTLRMRLDLSAIDDGSLVVVDYKSGGTPVYPIGNPQLAIYMLALRQKHGKRHQYFAGILQPVGIAGSPNVKWWVITNGQLDLFADNLRAAIRRVYQQPPSYVTGPWCKWCPGFVMCPGQSAQHIHALLAKGQQTDRVNAWILDRANEIQKHLSETETAMLQFAINGGKIPGWVVKNTLGKRTWLKDAATQLKLAAHERGISSRDLVRNVEIPIGITEVEKLGISTEGMTHQKPGKKLVRDDGTTKNADNKAGFTEI